MIAIAPLLEVIAPAPVTPLCAEAVAVFVELFVIVTPAAPLTAALIVRPATPLVASAPVEVFESVTVPVVEVSTEVTTRLAAANAVAVEVAVILRSP